MERSCIQVSDVNNRNAAQITNLVQNDYAVFTEHSKEKNWNLDLHRSRAFSFTYPKSRLMIIIGKLLTTSKFTVDGL